MSSYAKHQPALSERAQLVDKLDTEMRTRTDLTYYTTPHFIVIYNGNRSLYKNFGGWLDTHPASLANFLEDKLLEVTDLLDISQPTKTQVITVRNKGISDSQSAGYHSGRREHRLSRHVSNDLRYSHVFPSKKRYPGGQPGIYESSIHEALGHGISQPALFDEIEKERNRIDFLREGFANYVTHRVLGVDSHDVLIGQIIDYAAYNLSERDYDNISPARLIKIGRKKGYLSNIPLQDFFRLRTQDFDVSQSAGIFSGPSKTNPDYYRGPSFIKLLVDEFGVDRFKDWISKVNSEKFYQSLTEIYGKTPEELEREWHQAILDRPFSQNRFSLMITEDCRMDRKRRRAIQKMYRQLAE